MKFAFTFNKASHYEKNINKFNTLLNPTNYSKLTGNYNILNKDRSYINRELKLRAKVSIQIIIHMPSYSICI